MEQEASLYLHRRKQDGSLDSICLACLATIASRQTTESLIREEEDHVCKFSFPSRRTKGATPKGYAGLR